MNQVRGLWWKSKRNLNEFHRGPHFLLYLYLPPEPSVTIHIFTTITTEDATTHDKKKKKRILFILYIRSTELREATVYEKKRYESESSDERSKRRSWWGSVWNESNGTVAGGEEGRQWSIFLRQLGYVLLLLLYYNDKNILLLSILLSLLNITDTRIYTVLLPNGEMNSAGQFYSVPIKGPCFQNHLE